MAKMLEWLFVPSGLTPHGFCLTWEPALLWAYALSDAVTMIAYFSIPLALLWFMHRRRDMPNRWMGLLFVGFIIACGMTHGLSILTLWVPAYHIEVAAKALTACLSFATAVVLWPLVPRLLRVPSAAEMELNNRELAVANADLESFCYSVSHDLRAPLRAINGYTTMLLEDFAPDLPEQARAHLQVVIANSLRMGALIDALLAFARLGRRQISRTLIDPAELAREVVDELQSSWADRSVSIDIAAMSPCHGDRQLIKQVFQNLIENAVKYTRPRAHAVIVVGERPAFPARQDQVFFVRDNGVGFDMRYADRLFGLFQRLHRAEEYEGTGVGLALVHHVITRHGGRVWAEAKLDEGATICFTLGDDLSSPEGSAESG